MVPGLGNLDYDGKLKRLHLTRLVERRFRGDMIETFKLTTNNEGLNPDIFFEKKVERGDPELHRGNVIYKKKLMKGR